MLKITLKSLGALFSMAIFSNLHAAAIYVDINSSCMALTPCYSTNQEAVNNAEADDQIIVFPGIYAESIDLSLMGSALALQQEGNISFLTVDSNNQPLPHSATISPAADPGIHHTNNSFTGNIIIDGLIFSAAADDGIDFDDVIGNITIRNVIANGNDDDGVDLEFSQGGFTMLIENSIANNNVDHGFNLDAPDNTTIIINGVQANGNIDEGIDIDFDGDDFIDETPPNLINISITNTEISNNGDDVVDAAGMVINSSGTLNATNIIARDNAGPGLVIIDLLDTTLNDTIIENNGTTASPLGILWIAAGEMDIQRTSIEGHTGAAIETINTSVPGNELTALNVTCSNILGNNQGIYLSPALPAAASYTLNDNNFAGNTVGLTGGPNNNNIDATSNWWGDASGPTHVNNINGSGDAVHDVSDDPNNDSLLGQVDYQQFLTSLQGTRIFSIDTLFADGFDGNPCLTYSVE